MLHVSRSARAVLRQGLLGGNLGQAAAVPDQQWPGWQARSVYNDSIDRREALKADSFYDSTIERVSSVMCAAMVMLSARQLQQGVVA